MFSKLDQRVYGETRVAETTLHRREMTTPFQDPDETDTNHPLKQLHNAGSKGYATVVKRDKGVLARLGKWEDFLEEGT